MLLLTLREWFGPGRDYPPERPASAITGEKIVGMVTHLALTDAIRRLHAYQNAFSAQSARITAVEFHLIAVTEIDDLDQNDIENAGMSLIEDLMQAWPQLSETE